MKEILAEIMDRRQSYDELPLYLKRMFWCVVEHYMNKDDELFEEIWKMVAHKALMDKKEAKILTEQNIEV